MSRILPAARRALGRGHDLLRPFTTSIYLIYLEGQVTLCMYIHRQDCNVLMML